LGLPETIVPFLLLVLKAPACGRIIKAQFPWSYSRFLDSVSGTGVEPGLAFLIRCGVQSGGWQHCWSLNVLGKPLGYPISRGQGSPCSECDGVEALGLSTGMLCLELLSF
jgi:hypothetical protein